MFYVYWLCVVLCVACFAGCFCFLCGPFSQVALKLDPVCFVCNDYFLYIYLINISTEHFKWCLMLRQMWETQTIQSSDLHRWHCAYGGYLIFLLFDSWNSVSDIRSKPGELSICFLLCVGHLVMVPLNFTPTSSLPPLFFGHLFDFYCRRPTRTWWTVWRWESRSSCRASHTPSPWRSCSTSCPTNTGTGSTRSLICFIPISK